MEIVQIVWSTAYHEILYFKRAKSRDFLRFRAPAFVYNRGTVHTDRPIMWFYVHKSATITFCYHFCQAIHASITPRVNLHFGTPEVHSFPIESCFALHHCVSEAVPSAFCVVYMLDLSKAMCQTVCGLLDRNGSRR